MCIVCIANNINRNVYMYLHTRIFPTSGYARLLLFMFIRRELGGTGTGCLFQFTYCVSVNIKLIEFLINTQNPPLERKLQSEMKNFRMSPLGPSKFIHMMKLG